MRRSRLARLGGLLALLLLVVSMRSGTMARAHAQGGALAAEARLERRLAQSVVTLTTGDASATGFFVDPGGWLVTTRSVTLEGPLQVRFASGTSRAARVVYVDTPHELAVLRVDGRHPATSLALGDSDRVRVGDPVFTFRSPEGLHGTLTRGEVSARRGGVSLAGATTLGVIEMNHGAGPSSEGAPLCDAAGRVVGVIAGGSDRVEVAIPSYYLRAALTVAAALPSPPP